LTYTNSAQSAATNTTGTIIPIATCPRLLISFDSSILVLQFFIVSLQGTGDVGTDDKDEETVDESFVVVVDATLLEDELIALEGGVDNEVDENFEKTGNVGDVGSVVPTSEVAVCVFTVEVLTEKLLLGDAIGVVVKETVLDIIIEVVLVLS